jgi:hypothetical protein
LVQHKQNSPVGVSLGTVEQLHNVDKGLTKHRILCVVTSGYLIRSLPWNQSRQHLLARHGAPELAI